MAAKTLPDAGYRGQDEAVGQIIWKGHEPLCIPASSTDCVQCTVSFTQRSVKGVLLVEASDSLVLPQGLLLQPMVVSSSAILVTDIKVVLENESLKEVIVPAGTVVGQVYPTDTATPALTMTTSVKIDPEQFRFADTPIPVSVNCVMLCALRSKRVFKESPRYILFAYMLFNDSVQLILTSLLYVFSMALLTLTKAVCSLLIFLSVTTFRNAPFNLAVMSLERYVAICFPLRHAVIATPKRTYIAICVIWFFGSMNILTDIIFAAVMDPTFFYTQIYCARDQIFIKPWQFDVFNGFNVFNFVSMTVIIVFTYICIMITARSVSSSKDSAKKAHKTVLLHLVQLGLCLTSFLYGTLERLLVLTNNSNFIYLHLRYLNYVLVLILPRCLSPLIYGLRDDAVRPLFTYYILHCWRKFHTAVNVQ